MATYVDQSCYGWSHEELSHQDESREVSASQMLDHGSISFGRFAYESLSWEKRSVFTHNKCQEELEKFKSPGLVAKKKAYFEEYYRRIRAMKALQENQQTELTLDYGGDGSISSQTGEEDETTMQLESLGDGAANVVVAHLEEASIEEKEKEKEKECSEALEVHIRHPALESTLPNLDLSRNNFEDLEQEDNTIYPLQMQHLDTQIPVHESLTGSIQETEQHDLGNLDDIGVPRENSNSVTNIEPEVASQATTLYPTNSTLEDLELKPAYNMVPEKSMPAVRIYKDRPKVKEPSALARNGSKLEYKTKSDIVKPSRGPKYSFQKKIVKSGNGVGSSKATADKVSRTYKSTSVSSHRPLTEVHSNVTIPRPFSLATDRRAAVLSGSREGARKLNSKTSNKWALLADHGKDAINVQGTSKRTVVNSGMNSRELENKRSHEERKKPLALDSQCSLKARGANVLGPLKTRSINFPPRNKFSSNGGIDNRIKDAVREDKQKEGKDEAGLREIQQAGTKIVAPPLAGNSRTETKKIVPSWTGNLSLNVRKPQFTEQSLDGKKPRQERPRWR